jgi:hypothetical protein
LLLIPAKAGIHFAVAFVIPAEAWIQGRFTLSRTSLNNDAFRRCPSSRRKPGSILLLLSLVIPAQAGIQSLSRFTGADGKQRPKLPSV